MSSSNQPQEQRRPSTLKTYQSRTVRNCLLKLNVGHFLKVYADWLSVYLIVMGLAVLFVKLKFVGLWPGVLWLFVGLIPLAIAAWMHARRAFFTSREAIAYVDERLGAGGLLMSLAEQPDPQWEEKIDIPRSVWQQAVPYLYPKRFLKYVVLPMVFALAACLIPSRDVSAKPVVKNSVAQQATTELQAILETLKEEKLVDKEKENELQNEIEQLIEETRKSPLTHEKWETLESLKQQMVMQMQEMALQLSKSAAAAEALEMMAMDETSLTAEQIEQLQSAIGQGLEELAKTGKMSNVSPQMKKLMDKMQKEGEFKLSENPSEREQTLKELREFLEKECKNCQSACEKCQGGDGGNCEGEQGKEGSSETSSEKPGRGGTNRGRGDAELTWGDDNDESGLKFKETVLPPGFQEMPKEEIYKLARTAPNEDVADAAPRDESRVVGPQAGSESWNRTIKPSHQRVIQKYFQSGPRSE